MDLCSFLIHCSFWKSACKTRSSAQPLRDEEQGLLLPLAKAIRALVLAGKPVVLKKTFKVLPTLHGDDPGRNGRFFSKATTPPKRRMSGGGDSRWNW